MARAISQFSLLIWKNFVLQKRKVLVTCFELGLPILFAGLLMIIRAKAEFTRYPNATIYDSYSVNHLPANLTYLHAGLPTWWQMAYSPNTSEVTEIIENMQENLNRLEPAPPPWVFITQSKGFRNEDEMVSFLGDQHVTNTTFLGGIAFHRNLSDPTFDLRNYSYSIRLSSSKRNAFYTAGSFGQLQSDWETDELYSPLLISIPRYVDKPWGGSPDYMEEGFLPIQYSLDKAIMQSNNVSTDDFQVQMRRYPYPPYSDDLFLIAIQTQLPMIILLSLVYPILNITRSLVYEKEKRLKESMKMMGLHNWLHWVAWFVRYSAQLTVSVFVMTVLFTIPAGENGAVLAHSNPFLIFIFLELFAIASMSLAFLLSTFFKKANSSTAGTGVIYFMSYAPYFFIFPRYNNLSRAVKMLACLLSNDAMALGTYLISMYEGTGAGLTFDNFASPVSSDDNLSMLDIYLMFIVDIVLYLMMTWYIEAVFPGEFGIPRPWYFPFMKSYWCGQRVVTIEDDENGCSVSTHLVSPTESLNSNQYIEDDPVGMKAGIQIENLRKLYKGNNVAVSGMTINMYEGQITALLGHNGAGKTTTLSMLTGLFPPTSGTAIVNGHDIRRNIDGVHRELGLCPQHDVLYDNLTVHEHLYFFAKLKGCPGDKVHGEIDHYISALQLEDKRHVLIKALSGGMKRKLSVGIALIADSKIIMLDEPTSGMDPSARRFTWDILQQHREGRTILLTTHFMDEADLLGDRIAIMANGRLQCVGSSLFLKKKYGVGYHMSIAKAPGCPVPEVIDLVKGHVPSSQVENNVGAELSFVLPQEEVSKFEGLFQEMEDRKEELGIDSYGASVTTMEEVFIKVGDHDTDADGSVHSYGSATESLKEEANELEADDRPILGDVEDQQDHLYEENPIRNAGIRLYWQQFYALFIKRFLHSLRNWLLMVFQLLIPIYCTFVALLAAKLFPAASDSPPLAMNISIYGSTTVPYQVSDSNASSILAQIFRQQFEGSETSTEFLNDTYPDLSMIDYLIDRNANTTVSFNFDNLIGATFESSPEQPGRINGTALFNNQPYHTAPASLNAMDNAFLRYCLDESYSITTLNHPLPRTVAEQASDQVNKGIQTGFAISYNMLFGMSFLAASFVVFLIKENTTKARHLQFVSGIQTSNFWLSAYSWDLLNYALPCVLSCVLFVAFDVKAFAEDGRVFLMFLLLFLHGWAIIPLMYLSSFFFSVPSTGFVSMTMFNVLFGSTTFLAVEVLLIPALNLVYVGQVLDWVFVFSPSYLLGKAMADFYNNYQILSVCHLTPMAMKYCKMSDDFKFQENYLAWEYPGIGRSVIFLAIEGFLYMGIVVLVEMGTFRRIGYLLKGRKKKAIVPQQDGTHSSIEEEDQDVRAEREQIERSTMERLTQSFVLVMKNLRKVYPGKGGHPSLVAVEGSTLGVPSRECFGLLGVNGAGKTTTFKMLTGDEAVSGGDAYVGGFSIKNDTRQVQQRLGYCPQFDGLIDQLTGRETLFMYARLRGVPERRIAPKVDCLLRVFNMEEHADKQAKAYSGGNKRKLSTAVALIGDPPIVLLDEPSTGMDPVTRRLLWKALCEIRDAGRSIVLTSHSMEECEALCTRLAIMVNGSVKCLGSTQHLKSRFGQGYTLLIKASAGPDGLPRNMQPIKDFVVKEFRGSHLKDEHQGMVHYHITDTSLSWATIFGTLERAKAQYGIDDYSVSQTSLEQVFLNFARMQRDEEAPIA